jgi:hypothetical protein
MGATHPRKSTIYICFKMGTKVMKLDLTEIVLFEIHHYTTLYLTDL